MEPRIQYAKTKDEVSIAFWTLGEGMPVVQMPLGTFSHVEMDWRIMPGLRPIAERMAQKRRLVRYDGRGTGLSDRNISEFSLDAMVLDLEAVVDRLDLEKFTLFGPIYFGPVAITYAARHPERVSHLVLWCSYARGSDFWQSSRTQAFTALREKDWELYTETAAHVMLGQSDPDLARRVAAFMRECVTPEAHQAFVAAAREFDVTGLLPQVRSPTLVLHPRQVPWPPVDLARDLASRIPEARLALLDGGSLGPLMPDTDALMAAIDEFLGEDEEAKKDKTTEPGAFRTVLFTDVEGSTALTDRLGDAKARELLREHERMVREALKSHGGSEVKTMGDGFMASFSSATKALECAISTQRAFAEHNESAEEPILVRIGLNAGEPIAEADDLFGTAVNRAARITATANGGEILVANVVRELAEGKDFLFADRGEASLKGFDEPVRLHEVRWQD